MNRLDLTIKEYFEPYDYIAGYEMALVQLETSVLDLGTLDFSHNNGENRKLIKAFLDEIKRARLVLRKNYPTFFVTEDE